MPSILIENKNWGRCRRMRCWPPLEEDPTIFSRLDPSSPKFSGRNRLTRVIAVVLKRTVKCKRRPSLSCLDPSPSAKPKSSRSRGGVNHESLQDLHIEQGGIYGDRSKKHILERKEVAKRGRPSVVWGVFHCRSSSCILSHASAPHPVSNFLGFLESWVLISRVC